MVHTPTDAPGRRLAVVLFNLGGPDSLEAVEPFLFNLFNDPAIIALPGPLRWLVAKLISRRRAPLTREIYGHIGDRSPLLPLTQEQATALEQALRGAGADVDADEVACVIAMRYWHPMTDEAVSRVAAFGADEIVLLPLYPQYSTTTTASSVRAWTTAAKAAGLEVPTRLACCYPMEQAFVQAHVDLLAEAYAQARTSGPVRVLLSAHGLPQKVVDGGDPYQWQVERTAAAIVDGLKAAIGEAEIDHAVCYQSRVGPLKWLEPNTEDEIGRAARDGRAIVLAPVAFVSEHSETLVELDIEYRELAEAAGAKAYVRVPALGTHPSFIDALVNVVGTARASAGIADHTGGRSCPAGFARCCQAEIRL